MRLLFILLSMAMILALFVIVTNFNKAKAASDIEITPNETEHTVAMPYEKSFLFKATIKNTSSSTVEVQSRAENENIPQQWHVLAPTGRYRLEAGEQADFIAVFEPGAGPGQETKEESVIVPINFSWEGGSKSFDVTVKTKTLSLQDTEETAKVNVSLIDKNSKAISNATILAMLPSGLEQFQASQSSDSYTLLLPSSSYLEKIINQYKINHTSKGYYLQVSADGYQSYFEANYLPKNGEKKTIQLESLNQVGEYKLSKTIESGYSIWWIRSSTDAKYLAISQGSHGQPGVEPPDRTKILLANDQGEKLWEKTTGGECWGLDISADGKYVAAGCHDGKIYLWDREGKEVWVYDNQKEDFRVRWVKFSPDGNDLLAGPVKGTPEESGLFEVKSGKLLWSFYSGDWLREGRFSSDGQTTYFSSSNGTIYALETNSGKKKWLGSGEHVIPFLLGISEKAHLIVSAGKGRAFTGLDLSNGAIKWQTIVDQTITAAQMAEDGSVVGNTVGGMAYGLNSEGSLKWVRKYGGVGHNGVYYTKNGQYALFGGPNPTLFDCKGNILWQREKDKKVEMSSVQELNTGGANEVWMNEEATLLVLGGDDGKITFYQGEVEKRPFPWLWIIVGAVLLISIIVSIVLIIRRRDEKRS